MTEMMNFHSRHEQNRYLGGLCSRRCPAFLTYLVDFGTVRRAAARALRSMQLADHLGDHRPEPGVTGVMMQPGVPNHGQGEVGQGQRYRAGGQTKHPGKSVRRISRKRGYGVGADQIERN
jgi:hypothetical protein